MSDMGGILNPSNYKPPTSSSSGWSTGEVGAFGLLTFVVGLVFWSLPVQTLSERIKELETCGANRELITLSTGAVRCVRP